MKLWEQGKLKPMDVRIGNYVSCGIIGLPMSIVAIELDDNKDAHLSFKFDSDEDLWKQYIDNVRAVPISRCDGLLEQFGFIYDEPTGKWIAIKESETIYLKRDGDAYNVFTHGEYGVRGIVKYIHQLQNFVYDNLDIELR